jgi:hypothetical protein
LTVWGPASPGAMARAESEVGPHAGRQAFISLKNSRPAPSIDGHGAGPSNPALATAALALTSRRDRRSHGRACCRSHWPRRSWRASRGRIPRRREPQRRTASKKPRRRGAGSRRSRCRRRTARRRTARQRRGRQPVGSGHLRREHEVIRAGFPTCQVPQGGRRRHSLRPLRGRRSRRAAGALRRLHPVSIRHQR